MTSFTRANLLTNPSFETNTTGWSNVNGSILSSSATQAWVGTKSQKVVYDGTARAAEQTGTSVASYGFTNLTTYTFSAYVWVPTGQPAVKIKFGGPNYNVSGSTTTTHDQWERISVTATATGTNTAWLYILNAATSVANGIGFYVDGAMLEMSSAPSTYFDGSTAASGPYTYAWTGTANASTSNESVAGRVNNVTNPSCETNTTGWATVNGETLSSSATQAWVGTKSQKVVYDGSTRSAGQTGTSIAAYPFVSGISYTFSAYVWVPTGQPAIRLQYGGPTFSVSGNASTTHDQWERISVTATAGSNAVAWLYILNAATSVPNAIGFYVDGALLETNGSVGTYFDGATVNAGYAYAWTGTANASSSTERVSTAISSSFSGSGTLTTAWSNFVNIGSAFTGSGTLVTLLTNYRRIDSSFSAAGALTTQWTNYVNLASAFSGTGALATDLTVVINSTFAGTGSLSTALTNYQQIASTFSDSGTLSTSGVVNPKEMASDYSGSGYLATVLEYSKRFTTYYGGEGVLFTELGYVVVPPELGTNPLGKRVNYNVNTSAVPLNPTEGSGSAPGVSATYLKGIDPELALGEPHVLSTGNIGTYSGEIVNLTVDRKSSNVNLSMTTPLALLNKELHLFPFIDAAESTWAAVRAIDYWTQQCGLLYDKVPGEVIAYASAYGHNNAYAAGTTKHFYERLTGGSTTTTVVNERSVKTFGSAVTGTIAFHEDNKASIPLSMQRNRKLIFGIGLGIRGTGRTATVNWNLLDAKGVNHVLSISTTSAGLVTATVDGAVVDSSSVSPNGDYRVAVSLEPLGSTLLGKLTIHTDDLAGNGTSSYDGDSGVLTYELPTSLRLKSITHVSAGGSGSEMLRWGTYLTVDDIHPDGVPAVQKALEQSPTARGFVSGFEGNVWNLLNEFCSIARLDIRFLDEKLSVIPRITTLAAPDGNFSGFTYNSERRDKYQQVAVVNRQSKAVTTDGAVLWRADSVFQIAAREVFETTVQTEHSILNVVNPVAVNGIEPFPYKQGGGQYVVTGADGYIIEPAWWNDNGGKVEVSLTGKEGEIAIKITTPTQDTVRAPYRISEGEADRPALYISGSGILNTPKEIHVGTGAKNAKEGFDSVFESPFISGVIETYDTAMAMASQYSAMNADVDFEIPNDFDTPSRFGQFPAGTLFTDNVRNYRIKSASQTHSKVSGTASTHTTIGAYVASFPEGATIADANSRNFGATIKQFNIKPLRGTSETA